MQVSVSATSSGKGEKKIGRPLGSPNKTKLVPINRTAASRRRNTGTGHGNANEAPTAGAGRPAGVFLSPTHRTRSGSSAQDLSDSVDGLLLAAQSLYGNERDADMGQDADEEWSTSKGDFGDNRHSLRQEESFEALNTVPYLPTTPASLDGPDMTRFPRAKPASSSAGLPATPARMRVDSNGTVEPPQTPNTLARIERSALDVLAEEAASASKGPGMHTANRSLEALSGSARNLAQEMELARSLHDTSGFPGSNDAERRYSDHYPMPDGSQAFPEALGAAFSPHLHQGYPDTADQDYYDAPVPRTIAEQLAQGVDVSHPLIDPEDLQAGMTPAAALAKKSRSPYIKWTAEEDELLIQGVAEHGTKWEAVARLIPSRSYHQCRQRWLRGLKCKCFQHVGNGPGSRE